MTRAQRNQRVRMEKSGVLTMSAFLVDSAFLSKEDSRRLECEYDLFGHDSYMYLNCDDFEAVFTFTELTGAVITSYIMFLYEQIKKEQIHDRGICFMNPSVILRAGQRKPKHIEDASRAVADRLYKRKGNDIILLPYNPGFDFPFK
ncbi:putative papain-like cysteine peptidase superfamily [Helianthus annuus]|nr:putative papain-like cysteine peptidase superfamily [Helianthus annuus]